MPPHPHLDPPPTLSPHLGLICAQPQWFGTPSIYSGLFHRTNHTGVFLIERIRFIQELSELSASFLRLTLHCLSWYPPRFKQWSSPILSSATCLSWTDNNNHAFSSNFVAHCFGVIPWHQSDSKITNVVSLSPKYIVRILKLFYCFLYEYLTNFHNKKYSFWWYFNSVL